MSTTPFRRDGGLHGPLRLLFLAGRSSEKDAITLQQLKALGPTVDITTVAQADELLVRIREAGSYHAVIISHALPQPETLAIINRLRQASAPVAIVPVVTESQRDLYSSAVAVGADDVLIQLGGVLVNPAETLSRAKKSRHLPPQPIEPVVVRQSTPALAPAPPSAPRPHTPAAPTPSRPPTSAAAPVAIGPGPTPAAATTGRPAETIARPAAATPGGASAAGAVPSRAAAAGDETSTRQLHQAPRAELEAALTTATTDLRRAEAAHAADRAGWQRVREDLQTRLAELESVAAARVASERARELQAAEAGAAAAARIAALEATAAGLQQEQLARTSAEAALDAALLELEDEKRTRADDRAAWDQLRCQLEAKLQDSETAVERLRQANESVADDRTKWEERLRHFERQTAELEAIIQAHGSTDAALTATRTDLQQATQRHQAERAEWAIERDQLLTHVRELDLATGELRRAAASYDAERRAWDDSRQELEQCHAADVEALVRERAALDSKRAELESAVATLRTERDLAVRQHTEFGSTVEALEHQRDDLLCAVERHDAERRTWNEARADFEAALEASLAERDRMGTRQDGLLRTRLVGYATTTLDGRILSTNDALADLLGFGNAAALARAGTVELTTAVDRQILESMPVSPDQVFHSDSCLRRTDGSEVRVLEAAMLAPGAGNADLVIERAVIDFAPRIALEAQLRAAQRLGEAGRLAAAVAPDLDALPAFVDECVAQITRPGNSDDSPTRSAEALTSCAAHALPALRQLLAFIRKQAREPEPTDLNEALERTAPVLARLVGAHIDFSIRLGEAARVTVDEADFQQMVTTLFVTARDLLPAGGSLRIETERAGVDGPSLRLGRPAPAVSVTALGFGVQAYEPSPTLSAIVERCAGRLKVSGEAGKCTVLAVSFDSCGP